jgi:cyclic pyranopterin phosphate synthase
VPVGSHWKPAQNQARTELHFGSFLGVFKVFASDSHGRTFEYLRLSVTDVCNFRCSYCLPNGYSKSDLPSSLLQEGALHLREIFHLVSAFADLGLWKVRITGGEPTLRPDLIGVVQTLASVPGVRKIGISTNGNRLSALALQLVNAGVQAFNISLDSLDPKVFQQVTGVDRLGEILDSADELLAMPGIQVKLNAVLLRGVNDGLDSLQAFLEYIKTRPITFRFIELMKTGKNQEFFSERHSSAGELRMRLLRSGWVQRQRIQGDGPAVEFEHPEFVGKVGIIAPYAEGFCSSCNRLRVNSRGALRLCLFGDGEFSLRPWLQSAEQKDELISKIQSLLLKKEATHFLHEGKYGVNQNFSAIGG